MAEGRLVGGVVGGEDVGKAWGDPVPARGGDVNDAGQGTAFRQLISRHPVPVSSAVTVACQHTAADTSRPNRATSGLARNGSLKVRYSSTSPPEARTVSMTW